MEFLIDFQEAALLKDARPNFAEVSQEIESEESSSIDYHSLLNSIEMGNFDSEEPDDAMYSNEPSISDDDDEGSAIDSSGWLGGSILKASDSKMVTFYNKIFR